MCFPSFFILSLDVWVVPSSNQVPTYIYFFATIVAIALLPLIYLSRSTLVEVQVSTYIIPFRSVHFFFLSIFSHQPLWTFGLIVVPSYLSFILLPYLVPIAYFPAVPIAI